MWDRSRLALLEDRFLHESGRRVGAWRHLPDQARTDLRIEWLSDEALDTSAIEGEILNRASVQSSIRLQFGLSGDPRRVTPAEAGVAEMLVALYRTFDSPLGEATLWAWHRMLMRERPALTVIGGYRPHAEAMQVVSGPDYRRRVHYEAPPSDRVATEMDRFIRWYGRAGSMPALTRAGIAHFYFVSIHPFEDGNGRIGRALAEKALAQSLGGQTKALLRLFREEPDGFKGGLSAANYRRITGAPASTATRDLADLVAKRALRRTGERRHTRYWLDPPSSAPDVDDVADKQPPMR